VKSITKKFIIFSTKNKISPPIPWDSVICGMYVMITFLTLCYCFVCFSWTIHHSQRRIKDEKFVLVCERSEME